MWTHGDERLLELLPGGGIRDVLDQIPAVVAICAGPELVVVYGNPRFLGLAGDRPLMGRPVADVFEEAENRAFVDTLREAFRTGRSVVGQEWGGVVPDASGRLAPAWFDFVY